MALLFTFVVVVVVVVVNEESKRKKLVQLRLKKSNKMQLYADIYLLLNYSTYFGCPSRPSSGVYKTVVAASGTDLYQRLQLQSYVLLMMGAMDARNM